MQLLLAATCQEGLAKIAGVSTKHCHHHRHGRHHHEHHQQHHHHHLTSFFDESLLPSLLSPFLFFPPSYFNLLYPPRPRGLRACRRNELSNWGGWVWENTENQLCVWDAKNKNPEEKIILPHNCKENMQICDQKQTRPKIAQKTDLAGSWAPFGKGLGRSGQSWDHFWAHFDCLLDVPNHIFLKHWSKMRPKRSFGWLFNRFGEILNHFWTLSGAFRRFFFGLQNRTFIKHWSNMGSKRPFGLILAGFGEYLDASW